MKKSVLFFSLLLSLVLSLSACAVNPSDDPGQASEIVSAEPSSEPEKTVEIETKGVAITVPQSYTLTEGDVSVIVPPFAGCSLTVSSSKCSLDDFTKNNMTAALQTEFDFEAFNSYEKTEHNGSAAVIYDFDAVAEGRKLYIKQLNIQVGENVVTVTYCVSDETYKELFDGILGTVKAS